MTSEADVRRRRDVIDQARRDIDEVREQVAGGELTETQAEDLIDGYRREIERAERELADLGEPAEASTTQRSRTRTLVGAAILVLGFAVAVGLVGTFVQEREDPALQGLAGEEVDLETISNEAMEAILEANRGNAELAPALQQMEFRLAERYFEEGDYANAFDHYRTIIEQEPPRELYVASMTRTAWIVWVGNGRDDVAVDLLDQALDAAPDDPEALYVKGQVLWCARGETDEAVALFDRVLADPTLDPATVSQVEVDRDAAAAGETCS